MPTAAHNSRIVVVDSTSTGMQPLSHSMYAIVYVPSWLLARERFDWDDFPRTLSIMKEYFISAPFQERPFRAQRCLYSLKAISIYHPGRYSADDQKIYAVHYNNLIEYLKDNPVIAWDWIVTWAECRRLADTYPEDLIRLFRKFRSLRDTKRQPKPELAYFLKVVREVAQEKNLDMEHK